MAEALPYEWAAVRAAVRMTYDPGSLAFDDGRPLRVLKDRLGMMVIEPGRPGKTAIDLVFEGGAERTLCSAIGAVTALGLLVTMLWPWAVRRRFSKTTSPHRLQSLYPVPQLRRLLKFELTRRLAHPLF